MAHERTRPPSRPSSRDRTGLIGKTAEVELAIIGLAANGHLLIEDVPGVGKTMLAKSLARATGCTFKRIQFTPDLRSSDVTGVSIYNQRSGEFEFRAGPIVAHVVLADEINRATPKTQSALLEAMEEQQVTVEGITRPLPAPFIVLATQNPIEYEGTFRCPRRSSTASCCAFTSAIEPSQEAAVLNGRCCGIQSKTCAPSPRPTSSQQVQRRCAACTSHQHPALHRARRWPDPRPSRRLPRRQPARQPGPHARQPGACHAQARDYVIPDDVKALASAALATA